MSKSDFAINWIFTEALLLLPIVAWNSLIIESITRAFPKRKGKITDQRLWVMFAYAAVITIIIVALYSWSPLKPVFQK